MNRCIATLNSAAQSWWPGTVHALWQGLVVLGIVLLVFVLWRRAAPRWRYGLLLIALVKFALPPIGLPFGLFAWFPTPDAGGLSPAKPPAAIAFVAPQMVTTSDKASFDEASFDSTPSVPAALSPVHAISSNSPPSSKPLPAPVHSAPSAPAPSVLASSAPALAFTLAGRLFLTQVLGALGLLGFVLAQAAFLRGRMRRAETICSGPLYELASAVARRIGLRRVPRLCLVPRVQCPQAGGFRRSFALLPEWVRDASEEDRRALIAHELAHLRRGDPWVNAFQIAIQIWLWWNPVVWWLNRRIRAERELCCDDMVLTLGLAQGENYSRLLVGVAERLSRRELALEMVGMADAFRPVRQRVRRALDAGLKRPVRFSVISLVSLLMLAGVVLPGTRSSQEPSAPARVTPLVSPDGKRVAFIVSAKDSWGEEVSRVVVCDANGSDQREIKKFTAPQGEASWLGNNRLICSASKAHVFTVISLDGKQVSQFQLPAGCDVLYKRLSPDGGSVAFVGRYTGAGGKKEHGLFAVQLETGEVRRLLDTAVKTAPAWSPDSKRIAIANAGGYVQNYPLVIVDVESGKLTDTGVKGVGAAWSPDGRFLAFSTDIIRGGSWHQGIPVDGRIGVLDLEKNGLTRVTPPGFNTNDGATGRWSVGGSLNPIWSPDGRWIAYHRKASLRVGEQKKNTEETWIVNREGTEFRKVLDRAETLSWAPDGTALFFVEGGAANRIALKDLKLVSREAMPTAPTETLEPAKPAAAAPTTTNQPSFDPAPVFKRNRAWLKPDLDRLQSVSFTHSMASMRLDERFVWRRGGASLLEVVYRDDESSATEVGRRWITTSEPAQYYMKPKARLAKRENTDAAFFPKYFRDHLMGTRTRFTALEWGWNPDSFAIRNVEENKAEKTLTIRLAPSDSKFSINAGAMFHTTSWAYVPDVRIARSEITMDSEDHRILREVDYSSDGAKQCEIQFLDWQETGEGCAVPRLINLRFPSSDFEVVYRFQWHPEGLWILEKGESRFKKEAEPQRETIQDLKINQPTPELDEPLQAVADSRRYLLGDAAKSRDLSLEVNPFALGRIQEVHSEPLGKSGVSFRDLIFTLNDSGELIARINLQRRETGQTEGESVSLLLFDEGGSCPLAAAQKEFLFPADGLTSSVTVLFGKSDPLGRSKFFHLTLLSSSNNATETGKSPERASVRAVPIYPFGLAKAIPLDLADSAGGKTRLKQALFERNGTGELTATLELISQDEWKRFPVLLSLTLLGPDGKVKAASSQEVPFQVESEIAEVKAVLNLGSGLKPDAIQSFAVGLARGANTAVPLGSYWFTSLSEDKRLFPIEQMLEAPDDPQLRTMGLRALNGDVREKMHYELFILERVRQLAQEKRWTRAQQLAPHLGRLEPLLAKTDNPEALALLCRLLGHSGEKRSVEPLKRLLGDSRPTVRDGAAIGLGLLGDAAGFDRLAPILSLKLPEETKANSDLRDLQTDAAIALGVIGGDDAVRALGKAFVSAVEGTTITPGGTTPDGRGGGYSLGGTYDLADKLIFILERTGNPLILPYLKEALHCGGQRGEHVSREIAETLKGFKERKETLDVIVEGIRQGNSYILREAPKDPALLSEVGTMILRKDIDAWTFDYGVQFLMELNDPKALEPLREARKRDRFPENTEARLNLAAALIAYGDYQAFEDGFDALRIIMNPGTLIVEERESEMEERARKAKSLFDKIAGMPADELTKRLKPRLESEDRLILSIALQIIEHLPQVLDELKTTVEQAKTRAALPPPLPPALTVTQPTPNLLGSLVPEGGCKAEKTTTQTIMASHWRQQAPRLVTPDRYRPPFALTVQAMTDTTNIRLYYGSVAEGLVILNWEVRPTELRIHDLLTGQARAVPGKGSVSQKEWHIVRWEIAAAEMRVLVDGELRYQAKGEFAGLARPLGIGPALGSTVSVRSFVVEPLPAASERI